MNNARTRETLLHNIIKRLMALFPQFGELPCVGRFDRYAICDGEIVLGGFWFRWNAEQVLKIAQRHFPDDEIIKRCVVRRMA